MMQGKVVQRMSGEIVRKQKLQPRLALFVLFLLLATFSACGCSGTPTPQESAKVNRPQEPKKPYPYTETEVAYANPRAGVTLAGTLTTPKGKGPFPAVLLILGSGRLERDEVVANHKIFLVLSDYLTRRGLAVLRVDKRGLGKSSGDYTLATSEDLADDVLAGVEFLRNRRDIAPDRDRKSVV